jgi:hypothetical protein
MEGDNITIVIQGFPIGTAHVFDEKATSDAT